MYLDKDIWPHLAQKVVRIYTNGGCHNNSTPKARAGIGLWVKGNPGRYILAIVLFSYRQTNQVAELLAIEYILCVGRNSNRIEIYSDSSYSINCLTNQYLWWLNNNMLTKASKTPYNINIIQLIIDKVVELKNRGIDVYFIKVTGHSYNIRNNNAYVMVQEGVEIARREDLHSIVGLLKDSLTTDKDISTSKDTYN